MAPEQLQTLATKASLTYPLAVLNFLELYLDKSVQREHSISETSVYACFEDMLNKIKEKDLVLGFRKTYLDKERDNKVLTMLQLRDYHSAEQLCEESIRESEMLLPSSETLSGHIKKHILEETWIDIQKNMNEWSELYTLAEGTEKQDLLLESAFFTGNMEKVESLFNKGADEESTTNYIYYALAILSKDYVNNDQFENEAVRKFKEKICLLLMKEWFYLPKVFSENHIHQIAMSHFWAEFEEGFDILQELRSKKPQDRAYSTHPLKLKEDITFINLIRRQRLPNEADGLVNCKKIMEQRSLMSHILHSKIRQFIDGMASLNPTTSVVGNVNDQNRFNIFNETLHDAVMYCKIERSYSTYNSILTIKSNVEELIDQGMVATKTDEFYFYHELVKLWSVDDDAKEPPERVIKKLEDEEFNKDFRSDLHSTIMRGYLDKNMLENANNHGIEALKLNEDNWKMWTNWFNFYKKAYYQYLNTDKSLVYFKEMIKAYVRAIKYKPAQNLILFSEILHILYFREDIVKSKYNSDEALKEEVALAFESILTQTPVWTWTIWLGNLLLNVYKKTSLSQRLDKIILKCLHIAFQIYKPYLNYVLTSVLDRVQERKEDQDTELIKSLEECKNHSINNLKLQDTSIYELINIYKSEDLVSKNLVTEQMSMIYYWSSIESKNLNKCHSKLNVIGSDYSMLKNQDLSQKLTDIINEFDKTIENEKIQVHNRRPEINLKGTAVGGKFSLLNLNPVYNDRSINEFFVDAYLLPDMKIVYQSRRFNLQVEFICHNQKKLVYTLTKLAHIEDTDTVTVNSADLMCYNHYLKLMNIEMCRNNETVFRSLKFTPLNMQYLEEDYCLKAKPESEVNLIDVLDEYMANQGLKADHCLEMFANKRSFTDINKTMVDLVPNTLLKEIVLKKLRSEYDLFLWKKRYAQSLGVNMINTLLFVKGMIQLI